MSSEPLIRTADIEVLGVDDAPAFPDEPRGAWPCPACGERRPRDGARRIVIANQRRPRHERRVVVCRRCFESFASAT